MVTVHSFKIICMRVQKYNSGNSMYTYSYVKLSCLAKVLNEFTQTQSPYWGGQKIRKYKSFNIK